MTSTKMEDSHSNDNGNNNINGSSSSSSRERYAEFLENSCCAEYCLGPNPSVARFVYAVIFLVTCLLAWTIRDFGKNALSELERLKGCQGARYCLGGEGVLRISFGCFLFFFLMFLSTVGTKELKDSRNYWHSECWPAKLVLWLGFMVVPFFIPSALIQLYGKIAHFGAGIFLLIQLISVISFIAWINDCCNSDKYAEKCQFQLLVLSGTTNVASLVGIILMYVWYVADFSCGLNILFITLTLVLLLFMIVVSANPEVNAGFLAPGLMGMYIVYLCWSAIRSEPLTEACNKKAAIATSADWLTIVSFVIAVLAIVIATFSTGIDSKCLQFRKRDAKPEGGVPYGYGFFHFVFAMGAMYFGMLLVGWNGHKTMQKWTIDVGWASTWVRIANQWLAVIAYMWMLIAPIVWKRFRRRPDLPV